MAYITLQHLRKAVESLLIKIGNRFDFLNNKVDTLSESLEDVAFSGDYNDLNNKPNMPTIPQNISYFNNDAGYVDHDSLVYQNEAQNRYSNYDILFRSKTSGSEVSTDPVYYDNGVFKYNPNAGILTVPKINGYIIAGKKPDTVIGNYSTAEGSVTTASGNSAHAEGNSTTASGGDAHAEGGVTVASGSCAHAEGYNNTASGDYSHAEGLRNSASSQGAHAEGSYTTASGDYSHAEGSHTTASGDYSHAEGNYTTAKSKLQHVFGEYNKLDIVGNATTKGTYVEIVGNGTSLVRSDARTLDWSGNEVLAGKLTLGAGPTNNMDAATKQYVDNSISNLGTVFNFKGTKATQSELPASGNTTGDVWLVSGDNTEHIWNGTAWEEFGPTIDLSGYALSSDIPTNVSDLTNDSGFITSNDIPEEIFVATYGTTTYADTVAAYNAGKAVFAKRVVDNMYEFYPLTFYNASIRNLFFRGVNPGGVDSLRLSYTDVWTTEPISLVPTTRTINSKPLSSNIILTASDVGALPDSTDLSIYMQNGVDYVTAGKKSSTTLGTKATAEGNATTASGDYSHAEGNNTKATNTNAHAEGYSTTASGLYSHAEGVQTTASGDRSHAEGNNSIASGSNSHAEGVTTLATSDNTHAEGQCTIASNGSAHSEGSHSIASGQRAHAEGRYTNAYGDQSHAEGEGIKYDIVLTASGTAKKYNVTTSNVYIPNNIPTSGWKLFDPIYAKKWYTIQGTTLNDRNLTEILLNEELNFGVTQNGSTCYLVFTGAHYSYSHTEGQGNISGSIAQHVGGKFNEIVVGAEVIGGGTSNTERANIRVLDWSGNEVLAGKLTVGAGPTNNMDVATKQYVDSAVSGGISTETDPIFSASAAASITSTDISNWNAKISDDKTWNGVSLNSGRTDTTDDLWIPAKSNNNLEGQAYWVKTTQELPTSSSVEFVQVPRYKQINNNWYLQSTTPAANDNSTKVATTAFVTTAISGITHPVTSVNEQTGNILIDKIKTSAPADNTTYNLMGTASTNVNTQVVNVYNPTLLTFSKYDNNFARLTVGSTSTPGQIRLYSSTSSATGYIDLKSGSTSTNTRTITLPDADGTVALTSDIPNVSSWAMAANKPSYTFSELTTTPTTLGGYGITDAYTKTEVDGLVSGVLHYKGVKASASALPSSGNTTGDVWHITADGSEYAWDGSDWQELGTATDLSGYVPTSRTVNGKALSTDITLSASDVSALPSNTTYVSTFNGQSGAITYTAPVTSINGQTGAVTLTIPSAITNNYSNDNYGDILINATTNHTVNSTLTSTKTSGALTFSTTNGLQIGKAHSEEGSKGSINLSNSASSNQNYTTITPSATAAVTLTLPNTTGTVALTSDIPSVPSWALQSTKPTYTASEVGAVPSEDSAGHGGTYGQIFNNATSGITLVHSSQSGTSRIDFSSNSLTLKTIKDISNTSIKLQTNNVTNITLSEGQTTIIGVVTPTTNDMAANKGYVDSAISALTIPTRYDSSTNTTGYLTMADLPIYDGTVI